MTFLLERSRLSGCHCLNLPGARHSLILKCRSLCHGQCGRGTPALQRSAHWIEPQPASRRHHGGTAALEAAANRRPQNLHSAGASPRVTSLRRRGAPPIRGAGNPVYSLHTTPVASFIAGGSRLSTKPCHATTKGTTHAGVCLNSGSPDNGSTAGLIKAPTRASAANMLFQCMGTNIMRLGMSPLIRSRATSEPQRVIPGMVEEDLVRRVEVKAVRESYWPCLRPPDHNPQNGNAALRMHKKRRRPCKVPAPPGYRTNGGVGWLVGAKFS